MNLLLSFAFHQKTDLAEVADLLLPGSQLFADSGAYSAATTGTEVKLTDYAAWLRRWQPYIAAAATLDVIGDAAASASNTAKLEGMGLKVLPTFHAGSPFSELDNLCNRYAYIALGGMVPHTNQVPVLLRWLVKCFRIGEQYGTRFHGFGQTSPRVLGSLPFYSVDSSTWSAGVRFGEARLWNQSARRLQVVRVGRPVRRLDDQHLLRQHGLDHRLIAVPGFAQSTRRSPERFSREYRSLKMAGMRAHELMGSAMAARHQVTPPTGWEGQGTVLYLATFPDDLPVAISAASLGELLVA